MFREIFGIDFLCIANIRFLHNECSQINLVFAEKNANTNRQGMNSQCKNSFD